MQPNSDWPIRLNKYLAKHHPLTRRAADKLIEEGKVKINGQKAELGTMVNQGDTVTIGVTPKRYRYFRYHKPRGIATHASAPNEKSILDAVRFPTKVFPIGRLDKDSRGLIILSDDGRLSGALLSPAGHHEKEYVVTTDKTVSDEVIKKLGAGVVIEGYRTKKAKVEKTNDKEFHITLTEGKKHQIRRMCAALGLEVRDLERVRVENLELTGLTEGEYEEISDTDLSAFLKRLNLA